MDVGRLWRNLALLLATSVLPFPTAVLGSAFQHGSAPTRPPRWQPLAALVLASALPIFYGITSNGWHRRRP